jgi:two-component system, OmpR family, aerobic respiration control sensor histidine kinase ArcB
MSTDQKYILVVEDNRIAAKMAQTILQFLGCQVDLVQDGADAVKRVLENHYDGICMDIGLPDMSGVEACIAIRKHEAEHGLTPVPIVAVTGNNSPEEAQDYIKAGMQEVIAKPLTKEMAKHFLSFCKK